MQTLTLDVSLHVWDFTLPDYLSFLPEMNCYGLPANERDYYRLAHLHRTVLNRVPYHHSGDVDEGCAPVWDGKRLDWTAWDKRFGPYFDGSAFADLPRKGVPMECFYLPLFENWPTPMEGNYNGDYWADRAFPASYRKNFVEVSRQFAEHIRGKQLGRHAVPVLPQRQEQLQGERLVARLLARGCWTSRRTSRTTGRCAGSAPPSTRASTRRRRARRSWRSAATSPGRSGSATPSTACSITTWSAAAMRQYPRIVMDRKEANGEIVVEYAGSNAVEDSNMQPVGWCIDAWSPRRRRRAAVADDRHGRVVEEGRRAVAVLPRPRREGRADPVDPAEGVPPRPAGRGVSHAAGPGDGPAALGGGRERAAGAAPGRRAQERPAARTRA